jgi:uncharacterized protein YcbX
MYVRRLYAGPSGLLFDRGWVLVDSAGMAFRLKQHPALASIQAGIDLQRRLLLVTAPGEAQQLEVPLPAELAACALDAGSSSSKGSRGGSPAAASSSSSGSPTFSIRVCSRTACVERTASAAGGDASVTAWFSRVVGVPCRLVQQAARAEGPAELAAANAEAAGRIAASTARAVAHLLPAAGEGQQQPVSGASGRGDAWASSSGRSFANEGQLLVVGAASLADLAARSASAEPAAAFAQRFRCGEVFGLEWLLCVGVISFPALGNECFALQFATG